MRNKNIDRAARAAGAVPEWLVTYLPGPQGRLLRMLYWRARMKHLGANVTFGVGVQIANPQWVSIGDDTWIDDYVIILAGPPGGDRNLYRKPNTAFTHAEGEVRIGANCHIAQQVTLQGHGGLVIGDASGVASGARVYTLSHHYKNLANPADQRVFKFSPRAPPDDQALISSPVVLEDDTAIGLNSVVLPGSTVRTGSWIGTLSLVAGEIPPNSVASGSPAKVVKTIR